MSPKSIAHKVYQMLMITLVANQAAWCFGEAEKQLTHTSATSFHTNLITPHQPNQSQQQRQQQAHHQDRHKQHAQPMSKEGAQAWQNQNLNKFQRVLSEHQKDLVRRNPGSLYAVARAIKMAIKECQYQMRHEPWDCPIHGFSVRPPETFGGLMSRSFKETSFIQSLLSSAIAHSVARACTESMISTCSRKQLAHGNGYGEDFDFGRQFAREFMDVTHELQQQQLAAASEGNQKAAIAANSIMAPLHSNPASQSNGAAAGETHHQLRVTSGGAAGASSGAFYATRQQAEPVWKEKRLRQMINVHNDEVGRLIVLHGMRRECKCHGISGACSMQTCWLRLPPFREVANRLHDSLDKALRVEMYVAPAAVASIGSARQKSLTSSSVKKSNKKRSSSLSQPPGSLTPIALGRPAAAATLFVTTTSSSSPLSDTQADRGGGGGRLQAHQELAMNSISSGGNSLRRDGAADATGAGVNDLGGASGGGGGGTGLDKQTAQSGAGPSTSSSSEFAQQNTIQYASLLNAASQRAQQSNSSAPIKKRPIARSIGITAATIAPDKLDLLYAEESPDFCMPNERYNIKGTRGRVCSESASAANSCETLCCGRGYKTEIREEKYTCECKFQYCCHLKCNTCTRRKVINKCL